MQNIIDINAALTDNRRAVKRRNLGSELRKYICTKFEHVELTLLAFVAASTGGTVESEWIKSLMIEYGARLAQINDAQTNKELSLVSLSFKEFDATYPNRDMYTIVKPVVGDAQ
jgi:hypothetical protein